MIEAIGLKKEFASGSLALKSVDFYIEKGDLVCLLGPSGCGKSTVLNLVAGLLTPSAGDIKFLNKSVLHVEPKDRNIGFVFQNYALYPHMTALENIIFPLTVGKHKIKKSEAKKVAQNYMRLTHIEEIAHQKPEVLSGGQQQRVAITRALVQNPDILLLDEPLSNLDAHLRLHIREDIRKLVKKVGITALFVTHDQEEALAISDKIIVMNEGVVQQYDVPQKLYLEPVNLFVAQFIGSPGINTMEIKITNGNMDFGIFNVPLKLLKKTRQKKEISDGAYTFAIRPEDIGVVGSEGTVKMYAFENEIIGREAIIHFRKNNQMLKVIVGVEDLTSAKEEMLRFNFDKAFIFDESGKRVY